MNACLRTIVLMTVALLGLASPARSRAQQAYPTAEAAAEALVAALGTQRADADKLAALLGKDWRDYVPIEGVERADVEAFLAGYRERHAIRPGTEGRVSLVVGKNDWVFPIPLAKRTGGWAFDVRAGADEIRDRRVGRNELATVESARAYHDAQNDYARVDRDGDGVLEYAQKIFSSDGQHDGLFWADDDGAEPSPLGPLFAEGASGSDWHGYHYRILSAQGPSAPGGAYSYLLGKNMSRGFALVAWPAKYGDSGVMSFMISHEGQVFEKDLGPGGEKQAMAMTRFDPDSSWQEVKPAATAATR
ncbi:DUF2950 domain-containing protein [Agrilutibacter solisilvae]|uniref:DUF2950 domain-containing protein n=1 Tax=Agrilutibacter solisilvae TaxID=2763317 RepID=A0A974Y0J8_9GAMM|nr:DUF2950 domain-containing protein [Lysobacter solisilvae]QSX79187.1 DUF2950 domain-containing protein [Lysobacter solisilvae]